MNQRIANHLESLALNANSPHVQSSLNRAARNLRDATIDVTRIEDLKSIKGFGPYITRAVQRFFSPSSSSSSSSCASSAPPHAVPATVPAWLASIGMTRFEAQFATLGFDTLVAIKAIGEAELDLIGVAAPGHRIALRAAVAALNQHQPQPMPLYEPAPFVEPLPVAATTTATARKRPVAAASSTGDVKRRAPSTTVYMPRRLSGGWAILMVLHLHRVKSARPANDLSPLPVPIDVCRTEAQLWATHSMIKDGTHNYTAWSSLSTLREKFLVTVSKKQVALTPTGIQTAATIFAEYSVQQVLEGKRPSDPPFAAAVGDVSQFSEPPPLSSSLHSQRRAAAAAAVAAFSSTSSRAWLDLSSAPLEPLSAIGEPTPAAVAPEMFARRGATHGTAGEIVLIADSRERTLHRGDEWSLHLQRQLDARGVLWESRPLAVGDFAWILRAPPSSGGGDTVEHMLHVLVERKSVNDLACSLTDGRYAEQQQRIQRTGLALQFYVIEGTEQDMVANDLPAARLLSVMADLAVLTNLKVHRTANLHETVQFLQLVTSRLIADLRAGRLESTERLFGEFQSELTKQAGVPLSHLFVKQMYQVKGVSMSAALALAKRFGTCASLVRFLSDKPRESRIAALAALQIENDDNSGQVCARATLGSRSAACVDQMLFGGDELDGGDGDSDSDKTVEEFRM